ANGTIVKVILKNTGNRNWKENVKEIKSENAKSYFPFIRRTGNPLRDRMYRTENLLEIWIFEAKGVPVKRKYYCEICLDKTLYARTSAKPRGDICFWGEHFYFSLANKRLSDGDVILNFFKYFGRISIPKVDFAFYLSNSHGVLIATFTQKKQATIDPMILLRKTLLKTVELILKNNDNGLISKYV
ncbi:C2 domain protein, partial [Onchocerca flexuosa]